MRQVRCSIDIPEDDEEVQERLEVAASVVAMETFGVMATGRPCAIDSFLSIPLQYFSAGLDGVSGQPSTCRPSDVNNVTVATTLLYLARSSQWRTGGSER